MATACFINVYNSHVDRGATVTSVPLEHYEVDEEDIKVGERLPKLKFSDAIVKAYDGQQLTLELRGKTYTIKVGEEVEIDSTSHEVGMGVYSRNCYCVKLIGKELIYKGAWQWGDTILQKLAGPIGEGQVWYPNGDHFKGVFHLSYASINGPAYAADGRYDFADGSWIERAWIHTSKDRKPQFWGLHGVFRVHHPERPDSIAMFLRGGKRYGFELFLPEESWQKPWVKEWYAGDEIVRYSGPDELFRYEVVDYEIDETSKVDCTTLKLTLKDGDKIYRIEQQGGRYVANQYDSYVYEPSTHVTVKLPNGDVLDHYGDDVRDFQPYDGYVEVFCAKTGMSRKEQWKKGELVEAQEWRHDRRSAKQQELPCPIINHRSMEAFVWSDGHIEYSDSSIYDGDVINDMPEGRGVLTLSDGARYEGEFHEGRSHGLGVFDHQEDGIHWEGTWVNGKFQESNAATAPIILHAQHGRSDWEVGHHDPWKFKESDFEPELGALSFIGFGNVKITSIKKDCITLTRYGKTFLLKPGEQVSFFAEIEGREWSDGCVYDGTEYKLVLTWKN